MQLPGQPVVTRAGPDRPSVNTTTATTTSGQQRVQMRCNCMGDRCWTGPDRSGFGPVREQGGWSWTRPDRPNTTATTTATITVFIRASTFAEGLQRTGGWSWTRPGRPTLDGRVAGRLVMDQARPTQYHRHHHTATTTPGRRRVQVRCSCTGGWSWTRPTDRLQVMPNSAPPLPPPPSSPGRQSGHM